jgi:preprotein translocase subunit SecG
VRQIIFIFQIVLAVLMAITILIQQKGTGLGNTFGGDLSFYRTKRGAEKLLFIGTIVLAALFIASSLLGLIIH